MGATVSSALVYGCSIGAQNCLLKSGGTVVYFAYESRNDTAGPFFASGPAWIIIIIIIILFKLVLPKLLLQKFHDIGYDIFYDFIKINRDCIHIALTQN